MEPQPESRVFEQLLGDRRWRLSNLYFIKDPKGEKVLFKPNDSQLDFSYRLHELNLILKARQLGFTTFIDIFILDCCLFNSNVGAGIIAHSLSDAKAIFEDKIKYAYDNLPYEIKAAQAAKSDTAQELRFGNGSFIRVGTSHRSGTLQLLHVTEYGKISVRFPEKALEIKTGAFNTVHAGQVIFVESTAEGQEGEFYQMSEAAIAKQRRGEALTVMDFKFHFYPWWSEKTYRLNPEGVVITPEMEAYFEKIAAPDSDTGRDAINLDDWQKAWYVKKAETMGEHMKREFPSYPEEAFEQSAEGAYYGKQLARADLEGRITFVPHEPQLPVETWWDLGTAKGAADTMAVWFSQTVNREIRFIDYYGASGEGFPHFAKVLKEKPYVYKAHNMPHDIVVLELNGQTRMQTAIDLGIKPVLQVPKMELMDGIEAVRTLFPRCWFDKVKCAEGLRALRSYKKEWDDARGAYKNKPDHNWASHPADAFRSFGQGFMDDVDGATLQQNSITERITDSFQQQDNDFSLFG